MRSLPSEPHDEETLTLLTDRISSSLHALAEHLERGSDTAPEISPALIPQDYTAEKLYQELRVKSATISDKFVATLFEMVSHLGLDITLVTRINEYLHSKRPPPPSAP